MSLDVRVILINTSHPGNIGAAARAMKTMGLSQLTLVDPIAFPDPKAVEMASGANDILEKAIVASTLDEAIEDCTLIAGTSARSRTIPWPVVSPREFAEKITSEKYAAHKIAILFGREQSGLTNEELQRCHFHIQIPSHPNYSSLNLAAAVQIIAYEYRIAELAQTTTPKIEWDYPPATSKELEGFYQHLSEVLTVARFLKPEAPRQLMTRLRRLFNRTELDSMEINILRGILTALGNPHEK
ncbi:MAG: tRNA (cytosine(32)/uridine(32)-2'-O)-methyltransferase TrmJ [Gammaproteobacteria bacterium]|nr:tRNA (cytosine(32)/uridine(32)-2'-O)-methyltransferase TrmJ [Gammaproteobacteria bacterium]